MKRAFSLLELIFVIVVLGLVASMAVNVIMTVYGSYLDTKSIDMLSKKSEFALEQVKMRLEKRVKTPGATIVRDASGTPFTIEEANGEFRVIEWLGVDIDSFYGAFDSSKNRAGWNGFIDVDSPQTNANQVRTAGSRLDFATTILNDKYQGRLDLEGATASPVLLFRILPPLGAFRARDGFGWSGTVGIGQGGTYRRVHPVRCGSANCTTNPNILQFSSALPSGTRIYEKYDLVSSAYALVFDKTERSVRLYYDYRPWLGETYLNDAKNSLLVNNVENFLISTSDMQNDVSDNLGHLLRVIISVEDNATADGESYKLKKEILVN